jgi:hypothetical protein
MSLILGILDSGGAAAGAGGSYESIATVTVSSGGSSSVSFTSIPSDYTHLQIRGIGRTNRAETNDLLLIQFNSDTGSNYSFHNLEGYGGGVGAAAYTSQTKIWFWMNTGANSAANVFGAQVIDILEYKNTNIYKTVRSLGGTDENGIGAINFGSGNWRSTSAITSITLAPALGSLFSQYTQYALYGIKGA